MKLKRFVIFIFRIFSHLCQNLDDRGRILGIVSHTHIWYCFITSNIFSYKISNLVFEKTKFGKISFRKTIFPFTKRIFHQNKVQTFLVLIYDHTPIFTNPRTLFCRTLPKEFLSKNSLFLFSSLWKTDLAKAGRPTQSTDVHAVHVCTSADRAADRGNLGCSLFFHGRPDRPTDRETCSMVETAADRPGGPTSQRSKIRPLTVDRRLSEALTDSNSSIFLGRFVLGFSPTTLLSFVSLFSFPINRKSILQMKDNNFTKDLQEKIKVSKV